MMETKPIGLYVHIPFCIRKCNYCDFCSVAVSKDKIKSYTDSLISEIESYKCEPKRRINTVFFGGGTPSVLDIDDFERIVLAIREVFEICEDAEFSAEVNPATVTVEKAHSFKRLGVNRVSIGLQSIRENELKILGRIHTCEDFLDTFYTLRAAGIGNINVDLMYGIPEQTEESFSQTLAAVAALDPEHISAYGLIVEEGTPFYRMRHELDLPSEDDEYNMYLSAVSVLGEYGYSHYEISNYAKPGFECRHNLKYWRDEEYIGVGLAAHSYLDGKRYSNTTEFDEYFEGFGLKYRKEESVTDGLDKFEYAMLALRLSEGLSLLEYRKIFGEEFAKGKEKLLREYVNAGYMDVVDGRIKFTDKGFYVSNTILAELL